MEEIRQSINEVCQTKGPNFTCFELWNFRGVSYHWYLSRCYFIAFPQQHALCLSAASANIFDSILEVLAARVVLFSEGLHCYIGNYNKHPPPKKTVTHWAPATSYCYSSEHSTPTGCARSELQKGGSDLAVHKEGGLVNQKPKSGEES